MSKNETLTPLEQFRENIRAELSVILVGADMTCKSQLQPCGLGYLLVHETDKVLPCGCRFKAPYQGLWINVAICPKHKLLEQIAKIEELNCNKFAPTDTQVFCEVCQEIERENISKKDVELLFCEWKPKKFLIGEYFELYQGHPTTHVEEIIEAFDRKEAVKIADDRYGWGSWVLEITKECTDPDRCPKHDEQCKDFPDGVCRKPCLGDDSLSKSSNEGKTHD